MHQITEVIHVAYMSALLVQTVFCASEPSFTTTSYPHTVTFQEGSATAGGTVIHTFSATDDEADIIPFLNFVYDPSSSEDLFDLTVSVSGTARVAQFTLKPNEVFDYETRDTYTITATASDTQNSATAILTIQIADVGETPTLNPNTTLQSFTIAENAVGTVIGSPSFTVDDTDSNEVHIWSLTGGNGTSYVSINTNNGTITLKVNYDRDDAAYAENIYVEVTITDKYSLTVTTTYDITITDTNDHIPECNPAVYTFTLEKTTALETTVATLTCTDGDISSPNNDITYSFLSSDSNAEYFNITGSDIKLESLSDKAFGTDPFTVFVLATDGGSPAYTGTATLSFTIPEATTQAPTTTIVPNPAYDALSGDNNLTLLLIIASFVAACILGYIIVLCWRLNTFGRCLPNHCPNRQECRHCCTCCPGDDIEKAVIIDSSAPSGFVLKKGMPYGQEAPNSRRHVGSLDKGKKGSALGPEAPNSRRHVGSPNGNTNGEKRGSFLGPEAPNSRRKSPMSIFAT